MKKIVLIAIALLIGLVITAQEVVSSGGESQSVTGYQVSWTLGETVIETISSGENILTQGFQQTKLSLTPVTDLLYPDIELNIFPNPTQDFIIIHFNELVKNTHYSLFDLAGKILEYKLITTTETRLDLKDYPSGTYILKLYTNQQAIQNFRIVKN